MFRRRSLGIKFLGLTIGAMLLLAVIFVVQVSYSLVSARDQALTITSQGLEDQGSASTALLHQQMSSRIQERLSTIADTNATISRALLTTDSERLLAPDYVERLRLTTLPDGALADVRPGRITSIYLPAGLDLETARADIEASALLDALLPQQLLAKQQSILAAVFIGPSGMLRMYPAVDVTLHTFDLEVALQQQFSREPGNTRWLAPFPPPDFIKTVDSMITAVVTPIYEAQTFRGVIISYVSLGSLTADLIGVQPTRNSWVFVLDQERHVIASSERFLPLLKPDSTSEPVQIGSQIAQTSSPSLDGVIAQMIAGERGSAEITLRDQPHIITYRTVESANWSIGLAVPIAELTASAGAVSDVIRETTQITLTAAIGGTALLIVAIGSIGIFFLRRWISPLEDLAQAARSLGAGEHQQEVAIRSQDEIGDLAEAFNAMIRSVVAAQTELQDSNRQLEATVSLRTADLAQTVDQLQAAIARQSELDQQLRRVSTPVIPVLPGVLLMPLIGSLDPDRASGAISGLLARVGEEKTREIILDVTGIPVIDDSVAQIFLRAAQAARLMGARTVLTGIRPEVAQMLVALDADLGEITTFASLQTAIIEAFARAERRPMLR